MISSGGTIIETAKKIRDNGGTVNYCVVCSKRDETATVNLQKENIQLLCIASFSEIIETLRPSLSKQELLNVEGEGVSEL